MVAWEDGNSSDEVKYVFGDDDLTWEQVARASRIRDSACPSSRKDKGKGISYEEYIFMILF